MASPDPEPPPAPPEPLLDRESSWVEFNRRVLDQAQREEVPLLERVRFLTIVSSNFDEFFMVRVAALKRERGGSARYRQRLQQVAAAAHEVVEIQYRTLHSRIIPQLRAAGIHLVPAAHLTAGQLRAAADDFRYQIFPALSSIRMAGAGASTVASLRLHLAFRLEPVAAGEGTEAALSTREVDGDAHVALVAIPGGLDRLRPIPSRRRHEESFLLAEDSIILHAEELFPGYRVADHAVFRVTRDADLEVDEATDEDFIEAMAAVLVERRSSGVVRLEIDATSDAMAELLAGQLGLPEQDIYRVAPIDLTGLKALPDGGHRELYFPSWRPLPAPALADADPWQVLRQRDVLLHHPFETFDHVIGLLQEAAGDDAVLAIKMTLYRTSGDRKSVV